MYFHKHGRSRLRASKKLSISVKTRLTYIVIEINVYVQVWQVNKSESDFNSCSSMKIIRTSETDK